VARPKPGFQHLAKAEIGCFLSHRNAWAEIADSPFDWGAVFEDDMLLAEDSAAFLASTTWIPRKAHLVKLETFPLQRLALGQNHIIPQRRRSLE
jgi:glycosyl transferase family 25